MRKIFFIAISLFFFTITPFISNASTLFFLPQNTEHQRSNTFIKILYIDTGDQKINTVASEIIFDQDILEVVDIITGDSIVELWMGEPVISNENGSIKFTGGIPGGYSGKGIIIKIIFKAKKTGTCNLSLSDTKVLLNDNKATEDEVAFSNNGCNTIEKSDDFIKIISDSGPNQNEWQNNDTISLYWDLTDETQYSYILSRDSMAEPDEIPDKPEGELIWMGNMSYKGLEDDIYYFHLKQKLLNEEKWSPKVTTITMIDTTNPEEFISQIVDIEGKKYLAFSTADATSGIDHYEVLEIGLNWLGDIKSGQETEWKIVESPYLLEDQNLRSIIKIKAVDKADNERLSEIVLYSGLKIFPYQIIFLLLVGVIIIFLIIWKVFFRKKEK